MRTKAIIRNVNNQYCVFSKSGKNLGCFKNKQGALKRLRQVEFFKNKGAAMVGSVGGIKSKLVRDGGEHFKIDNKNQAMSAFYRVQGISEPPIWFSGSVEQLRGLVKAGIISKFPDINVKVSTPIHSVIAGVNVKNPNANPKKVPQVPTPTLENTGQKKVEETYATLICDETARKAFAGDVIKRIEDSEKHLKEIKRVAQRLMKSGISGEEFAALMTFTQEDIVHQIKQTGASGKIRSAALTKMVRQKAQNPFREPQKPTDGDKKKKKKKKY